MKINMHAGHNPDGKVACGATGFLKESTEARNVKNAAIKSLKAAGHTAYDCTVNNGTSQGDILRKIVTKCNVHTVDVDVSIHLNCGAGDKKGNGKTTGVEVYIASENSKAKEKATCICEEIAKLGFKNRGVKVRKDLYVLNHTKAPALLVECCFVDDKDDAKLFDAGKMAKAIVAGLTGKSTAKSAHKKETKTETKKKDSGKTVRVTAKSGLNCRKGPGTKYGTVMAYPYGSKLKITEETNGWGKTSKGWVKLEYTKKI